MGLESKVAIGGEVVGEPAIDREKVIFMNFYKSFTVIVYFYLHVSI